jgi:hypothetical protein
VQRQAEIRADVGVSEMSLGVHEEEGRRGSLTVPRRIEVEKHSRTKLVLPLLRSQEYQRQASPAAHSPAWLRSERSNLSHVGFPSLEKRLPHWWQRTPPPLKSSSTSWSRLGGGAVTAESTVARAVLGLSSSPIPLQKSVVQIQALIVSLSTETGEQVA